MQKPADTHFMPALIIEWNGLPAGLGAVGMRMIVPQLELRRRCHWDLLPELFDRFMIDAVVQGRAENTGQFAVMKACVEAFEPGQLLPHCLRDVGRTAAGLPTICQPPFVNF